MFFCTCVALSQSVYLVVNTTLVVKDKCGVPIHAGHGYLKVLFSGNWGVTILQIHASFHISVLTAFIHTQCFFLKPKPVHKDK